jgi:hypothetical protein
MTTPPKSPSRFRMIVTTTGPAFLDTKTGKLLDAKGKALVPDQSPKPKPRPGRQSLAVKPAVLAEADRREQNGEAVTAAALHAWAVGEFKKRAPAESTIAHWLTTRRKLPK